MTLPERVWIDETSEDCDGFIVGRYDQKYGNVDQCYIRDDLIPQWRPIEEWDGQRPYHCAFSQAFDDGVWVVVPEGHPCTHFMQLTPPESNHD